MKAVHSPIGTTAERARQRRAARSASYREAQRRLATYEAIARQVIKHRAASGLSQKQLADRVGTSHSAISRLETGQHASSVETLRRIAQALNRDMVVNFAPSATSRRTAAAGARVSWPMPIAAARPL